MSYWDTSALVKLYAPEADSARFRSYFMADPTPLITTEYAQEELWVALRRKEAEGILAPGEAKRALDVFDDDIARGDLRVIAHTLLIRRKFEHVVETCFAEVPSVFIRAADALHLATALDAGESRIVATDKRLRTAAALLGFSLFPPPSSPP